MRKDPRLDPEVQALLEVMEAQGAPPLESLSPEDARQAAIEGLKYVAGPPAPMARVEDRRDVRVRVYTPQARQDSCLVYFHGGGWVVCDLETHDVVCRAIAQQSGAVVVAVDYRLAPEYKFPAAVEDAYAAVLWAAENVSSRVSVGGDSAGGNLAAVMALKCRDEGGPRLASQVLIYPVTNLAAFDTASYREFAEGYNLTRSEMDWFRDCYLARPEDGHHPHASPLLAADLRGLPPALVITAECDVLRDEGEAYARRLEQAGVPVTCTRYPGMIHPFLSMPGALTQARKAIQQVADYTRLANIAS